jgi:hypothetical protein
MADDYSKFTGKAEDGNGSSLGGSAQQVGRGVLEAVPFVGEKMAESAGLPQPKTFTERLTKRAATNLPYALGAGVTGVGAIPAAVGFVGATGLGQAAEELGVSKPYQPVFEMLGGGLAPLTKNVSGKVLGYIEEPLEQLAKKASKEYEIGPGAKTAQGMKYGTGETPTSALQNLNKFTEQATARAGNPTKTVDANWINSTGKQLGTEVNRIFAGQTFNSSPAFVNELNDLSKAAESAFGQQGNVVKTILEKNIGGQRAGGALVDPQFAAEDLRKAIVEVNGALSSAKGNQAKILHDLKDSLENIAEQNLKRIDPTGNLAKQYNDWRTKYNSFATIRDVNEVAGRGAITAAGQINPSKLLDVVTTRTGGDATKSPLFSGLAEYGDIMKYKPIPSTGVTKGVTEFFTESPIAKALKTGLQTKLPTKAQGRAGYIQPFAPAQRYTQIDKSKEESKDPYSQFTGGQ